HQPTSPTGHSTVHEPIILGENKEYNSTIRSRPIYRPFHNQNELLRLGVAQNNELNRLWLQNKQLKKRIKKLKNLIYLLQDRIKMDWSIGIGLEQEFERASEKEN